MVERRSVTEKMITLSETIYLRWKSVITCEQYASVCEHTLNLPNGDACEVWCQRLAEQYPETLPANICQLKLYFRCRRREAFFSVLEALKKSSLSVDREALDILRVFQSCEPER